MPLFTLLFLCGDLYLQTLSHLPSMMVMIGIGAIGILSLLFTRVILSLILGFIYTALFAYHILSWKLPDNLEGRPIMIRGIIATLPESNYHQTQFEFKLQPSNARVKLTWAKNQSIIHVGDEWQFNVRLKKIHGTQNEAAFDYDAWSFQKGLRATGYIINGASNQKLSHHWYYFPLEQIRENIRDNISLQLPNTPTAHWLLALTVGERSNVAQAEWHVLQKTGTNHLMAIAGLHIGILSAFILFLTRKRGYILVLLFAFIYSALAGFSLPTERAIIMLSVYIFFQYLDREINPWHAWSLALLLVLLLNPMVVLDSSFWLSFGTIATIIYGMSGRLQPSGLWWKWGRVQYVISLGLIPLSILIFQQCSLVSLLANAIAIPVLEFCILPFCFLALIFIKIVPIFSHYFLIISDYFLGLLWSYLTYISQLHLAVIPLSIINIPIFISLMMGILILLLPKGTAGKLLSLIFILPILLIKPARPTHGNYWVTVLDVGQGLSTIVETKSHTLIFDTGPSDNPVALPYLAHRQLNKIDAMVISHHDMDHRGGANALIHAIDINKIYTSNNCLAGNSWQWDGVTFSFIYPDAAHLHLDNNSSCVLRVTSQSNKSVLLPGDIEDYAESEITSNPSNNISADILIAPHHGSKTSINSKFITAVHPNYVVYATGYRNRYHFPHDTVVDAYTAIHAMQFNSAQDGEIQFKIDGNKITTGLYRKEHQRYYW